VFFFFVSEIYFFFPWPSPQHPIVFSLFFRPFESPSDPSYGLRRIYPALIHRLFFNCGFFPVCAYLMYIHSSSYGIDGPSIVFVPCTTRSRHTFLCRNFHGFSNMLTSRFRLGPFSPNKTYIPLPCFLLPRLKVPYSSYRVPWC